MVGQPGSRSVYRSASYITYGVVYLLVGCILFSALIFDPGGRNPLLLGLGGLILLGLAVGTLRKRLILSEHEVIDGGMFRTRRFQLTDIRRVTVEQGRGGWGERLGCLVIEDEAGTRTPIQAIGSWRGQHARSIAREIERRAWQARPHSGQGWAPQERPWRLPGSPGPPRR